MHPLVTWPQVILNATVYRARVGEHRTFKSEADALAYESGYARPHDEYVFGTPAHQGAADWHAEEERRYWRKREQEDHGKFEV